MSKEKDLTYDQFKKQLVDGDLLKWINHHPKSITNWLATVEDWAGMRYDEEAQRRAYEEAEEQRRKESKS